MVAGKGIIVKVVEHLFREVGTDAAKDVSKDLTADLTKDAGRDAAKESRQLADRTLTKDPIDVVTGEVTLHQTDVSLAGILPLVLERTHLSSYRRGRSFGVSWACTLDQRLEVDSQNITFIGSDGMVLSYPHPVTSEPVLARLGARWALARNSDGFTVADPQSGRTLHFAAAPSATLFLTTISDRNGNRIEVVRDTAGVPTEVRHSGGYRIRVDSVDGRVTALRLLTADEPQVLVRYGHDEAGNLLEVVNSSNNPLCFDYDSESRLTGWLDRNGFWYRYEYDDQGRGIRGSGSDSLLNASLSYDSYGRKTTVTDSLGATTTYHFNAAYQVVTKTGPLGHSVYQEWDRHHRLLSQTDQLNRTTVYDYDAAGNLTSAVLPGGRRLVAEYNEKNLAVRVVEPDGAVWLREYDQRANLIAVTDPLGAISRRAYDERGGLAGVTDALGATTSVTADTRGLPLTITDPQGSATSYTYDAFGRLVSAIDPMGSLTRFSWTIEGELLSRTSPRGATEQWSYDAEGNAILHIDPLGRTTRTEYGAFDVVKARTGPDGARLEFGYDTELRLISVTNPHGLVWRYDHDAAGSLLREVDFDGRVLLYSHDAAGQLVKRINGNGATVHYLRDVSGNIVEERGLDWAVSFTYDLAGRLIRAVKADSDVRFERDQMGRVVAESCNGRTLSNAFDPLGRRIRRRTPSGAASVWSYAASGLPLSVHAGGRSLEFGYDAAGREIQRLMGGVATLFQEWDADHRLRTQSIRSTAGDIVQQRTYSYSADGNVIGIDDRLTGSRRFELDLVGRVTAVDANGWTERYAYDAAGNLAHASWPSNDDAIGAREYSGTVIRRAGRVTYQHDPQGRLVLRSQTTLSGKRRIWRYGWDADDRLIAVTTPTGEQWRYLYDPFGRRIAKQRLGIDGSEVAELIEFSWDGAILAEQVHVDSRGAAPSITTWDYEPGTFRPLLQTVRSPLRDTPQERIDDQFHAIVTDLVGSPAELVDPDGAISWNSRTSLWGKDFSGPRRSADCALRFPGQYYDRETGFHYNYYRYYEPDIARYQSSDPAGLSGGFDPFGYARNPQAWIDPLGLAPCDPRNLPGTASGAGGMPDINGRWLRGAEGNAGRFPGQIARQLDTQTFKNFKEFREAFWAAVAKDPDLSRQFSLSNIKRMEGGNAPFVVRSQQVGGLRNYVLHHATPIHHGGGVYDMRNIVIVTPRFHREILDDAFHRR